MFKNSLIFFRKSLFSTSTSNARIFFGNFPIGATEFTLKKFFNGCGEIDSVTFFKVDETGTSQGYGSVLFKEDSAVESAIKLNSTKMEDKPVTIKKWEGDFKAERNRWEPKSPNYSPSNCLYIGNLPYAANNEAIINLFQEYGNVVTYRRPFDKMNERPKGFAYVQYETTAEAEKALESMNGYALGDRQIVVDFAAPRPEQAASAAI